MVGSETKRILRRAMMGIIAEKVSQQRDKLGFSTPEDEPFRGPLRDVVLLPSAIRCKGTPVSLIGRARLVSRSFASGRPPVICALRM